MSVLFLLGLIHTAQARTEACSVDVWLVFPCTPGHFISEAPDESAKVIGLLPLNTEFTAINSKNGYIQFKNPVAFQPELGVEWVPITKGPQTGWVHGGFVKTAFRDHWVSGEDGRGQSGQFTVFSEPSPDAKPVATWTSGEDGSPVAHIPALKKVLACKGGWLKVDLVDGKEKAYTGWIRPENQCSSQVTTCP